MVRRLIYIGIAACCLFLAIPADADGHGHHPCLRDCVAARPQVCEYNLTIEWNYVLSKACRQCPFVTSDCFRPHCVSADGKQRPLITVNKQMPGPAIEVCEGDTVRVWVENKMEDGGATSIHWHGLHQRNTGFMDGVSRLTQCSIPPSELFRYEFKADNAGTHWYHGHEAMQLGDGLLGPFIVRKQKNLEPAASLYDVDDSDHIIVVQDWSNVPVYYRYLEEMNYVWVWPPKLSGLINGRGQRYMVEDGVWETFNASLTPYQVVSVSSGMRYRFRLIGAMGRCYFRLSVDNHTLVVIATDGSPLQPVTVDAIMLHPGERYDVILNADQPVGNYWMKADAFGDCSGTDADAFAVLHYENAPEDVPGADKSVGREGKTLNPDPPAKQENDIELNDMMYDGETDDLPEDVVDVRYYIRLIYLGNDNTRYNHPIYYPVKNLPSAQSHITPTLNKITNHLPAAPLFTQWADIMDKNLCSRSTINETDCENDLCYCTHFLEAELGQVVELFMVSDTGDPHQMHLHGYSFHVVGFGQHSHTFGTVDIDEFIANDEAGLYSRKLDDAPRMDTVTVHKQSYVIIRFKADNPGMWFFHCHNEGHLMQGMSMVIKVGTPEEFPEPPNYFPRCGGYRYNQNQQETCVSAAPSAPTPRFWGLLVAIALWL